MPGQMGMAEQGRGGRGCIRRDSRKRLQVIGSCHWGQRGCNGLGVTGKGRRKDHGNHQVEAANSICVSNTDHKTIINT